MTTPAHLAAGPPRRPGCGSSAGWFPILELLRFRGRLRICATGGFSGALRGQRDFIGRRKPPARGRSPESNIHMMNGVTESLKKAVAETRARRAHRLRDQRRGAGLHAQAGAVAHADRAAGRARTQMLRRRGRLAGAPRTPRYRGAQGAAEPGQDRHRGRALGWWRTGCCATP